MSARFQTMTKRFRIRAYADDVAEVTVDLNHDDFQAVSTVIAALANVGKEGGYAPNFEMHEVDSAGETVRTVIEL